MDCYMDLRVPFQNSLDYGAIESLYLQEFPIQSIHSHITQRPKRRKKLQKHSDSVNFKNIQQGFDIIETYLYFKGLPMDRRIRFDFGDDDEHIYRVVKSGERLIIFRDLLPDRDDTDVILEILKDDRLYGISLLEINFDAKRVPETAKINTYIITAEDFHAIQIPPILNTSAIA